MEEVWASHTQCTAGPRTSPSKLRNRQQNMKSFNIQLPVVSKLYVCFYYYSMMTDLREAVGDSSQVLRSICFSSFLWMLNKQCHGCELYSYPPFLGPFLSHSCLLHMTAEIYWTVDTRPPEVTDQGICCRMSFYQAIFINLEFPSQLLVYFIFLWQVRGTQTNDLPPGLLQELRTTEGWIFPLLWSTYDRLMTRPTSLILCVWPVSK